MRKISLLLIGLLLLIGCGGADQPDVGAATAGESEISESRGAEQAARATPLPPRDKSTPSNTLSASNEPTLTQMVTTTESIRLTVRGDVFATPVQPNNVHCLAAQHPIREGD
jgi:hypothetical protein